MCKKLYRDAVQTPCCHETFCDMCIRESLLGSEYFMCPKCSTRDVSPDALTPYVKMRLAVARYVVTSLYQYFGYLSGYFYTNSSGGLDVLVGCG